MVHLLLRLAAALGGVTRGLGSFHVTFLSKMFHLELLLLQAGTEQGNLAQAKHGL